MSTRGLSPARAPATKAAAAPSTSKAPAPSMAQAGGAAVKLGGPATASEAVAPGEMDLKPMADTFKPPTAIADFIDGRKRASVNARFGKLAQGAIEVESKGRGQYRVRNQRMVLTHALFARLGQAAPGLAPCLVINVEGDKLKGHVGLAAGAKLDALDEQISKAPEILGLVGISMGPLAGLVNTTAGGRLRVGVTGVPITLGRAFSGKLTLIADDETITFSADASIKVKSLASGALTLKRDADGLITGKANVGLQLPKNFSGSMDVAWDGQAVNGVGTVGYQGEKLSGSITLRLMDKQLAQQLEEQKKAPPEQAPAAAPAQAAKQGGAKIDYVVFGEGDLNFAFNAWLNGKAQVIVDPKGYVTIIGKITPQKEFELFPQKDYVKPLFKTEIRASYGIPVVGNIFIFANIGMDAFAKLGPAKFYKIIVQGTYSTDPAKCQDFSIQGSLNISAAAGARLRAEAGAGLEVLGHDIKAGAGVNGIAGIKGYAEATPVIGYREKAAPGEDKKGEWFIRGDLEIVAQPFLGLSGDLFVEIDAPWWSPVPDNKWTWPLGGKEWPLGGPLGVGASVDYVFGSGQWPKLDLKPVEFSPDKFMTDLYADKAKPGKGGDAEKPGKWNEKNSKAADPPAKASPKGNTTPGKPAPAAPAKSRVQPGGTGKGGKHANPHARTANGKTVQQYQDEAVKSGKKPPGGDVKASGGKTGGAAKDKGKKYKEEDLKNGLAALEAVVTRYAKDGATQDEVETGVKSVRNKFKQVFKYIKVVDGGDTWNCEYAYNPTPPAKKVPKKKIPATKIMPASLAQPGTVTLRAQPLTRNGISKGSDAKSSPGWPDWWKDVEAFGGNKSGSWVRMHLLAGRLGGPGNMAGNLVPADVPANNQATRGPEVTAHKLITDKKNPAVLSYVVTVSYMSKGARPDLAYGHFFPTSIHFAVKHWDDVGQKPGADVPFPGQNPIKVAPPPKAGVARVPVINSNDGYRKLVDAAGITEDFALWLRKNQPFSSKKDLWEKVDAQSNVNFKGDQLKHLQLMLTQPDKIKLKETD